MEPELKLKTLNDYKHTSLKVLHRKLGEFFKNEKEITIDNIKQNVNKINAYKNNFFVINTFYNLILCKNRFLYMDDAMMKFNKVIN